MRGESREGTGALKNITFPHYGFEMTPDGLDYRVALGRLVDCWAKCVSHETVVSWTARTALSCNHCIPWTICIQVKDAIDQKFNR